MKMVKRESDIGHDDDNDNACLRLLSDYSALGRGGGIIQVESLKLTSNK